MGSAVRAMRSADRSEVSRDVGTSLDHVRLSRHDGKTIRARRCPNPLRERHDLLNTTTCSQSAVEFIICSDPDICDGELHQGNAAEPSSRVLRDSHGMSDHARLQVDSRSAVGLKHPGVPADLGAELPIDPGADVHVYCNPPWAKSGGSREIAGSGAMPMLWCPPAAMPNAQKNAMLDEQGLALSHGPIRAGVQACRCAGPTSLHRYC